MNHTIGISEMCVTNGDGALITYSLGSCVGLSLYDPELRLGGMIHCMLPLARIDREKASQKPCMFTDTGVALLLKTMYDAGARRENLVAKLAGGGAPLDGARMFNIGERNIVVLRKILWKNDVLIDAEDTGGTKPRTMKLALDTGVTTIKSLGEQVVL